uniref:CBS domain-containing protein n=1 Tax=Streptomyces sp. RTGN2 TaxID=3016525 RepID=UPI002553CC0C
RIGRQQVADVMETLPTAVPATSPLSEASGLLSLSGHGALPVLDASGDYLGVVTAQSAAQALAQQPAGAPTLVGEIAEQPPRVTTSDSLATALKDLVDASGTGVPVLDETGRPVGWLSHQGTLRALHAAPSTPASQRAPSHAPLNVSTHSQTPA